MVVKIFFAMRPRLDRGFPNVRQLSALGIRPAVAMLIFPQFTEAASWSPRWRGSPLRERRAVLAPGLLTPLAIMDGKVEARSNKYDESNVNRL
jgi:hypothetical protein